MTLATDLQSLAKEKPFRPHPYLQPLLDRLAANTAAQEARKAARPCVPADPSRPVVIASPISAYASCSLCGDKDHSDGACYGGSL